VVRVSWQDEGWADQSTHQAATVVIKFLSRGPGSYQDNIRLQAREFAFDIVHFAKRQNLMTVKTNQVGKCPTLRVDPLRYNPIWHHLDPPKLN